MIKTVQKHWIKNDGWKDSGNQFADIKPQLVLVFAASDIIADGHYFKEIESLYPGSLIVSCSTAGEIENNRVTDRSVVLTAVEFESTKVLSVETIVEAPDQSESKGLELAKLLPHESLVHAMVFSDGLHVNGTALVNGLRKGLPTDVSVTGGLVGDGEDFKHTYVGTSQPAKEKKIVLVGFYGKALRVGYGSLGGWDTFGVDRMITKSKDNVLYELDGQSALGLYKNYLGDKAAGLPASGLLFPLSLRMKNEGGGEIEVVRTLLGINEDGGMVFAGDMPEGIEARLMKANFERLLDGADGAANMSMESLSKEEPELAILISCIGRKLVLKERIEEEIEAVRKTVGPKAAITGFYSYGELCPTASTEKQCQLHNQTMTITVFKEV